MIENGVGVAYTDLLRGWEIVWGILEPGVYTCGVSGGYTVENMKFPCILVYASFIISDWAFAQLKH